MKASDLLAVQPSPTAARAALALLESTPSTTVALIALCSALDLGYTAPEQVRLLRFLAEEYARWEIIHLDLEDNSP